MKKILKYVVGFILALVLAFAGLGGEDKQPEVVETTQAITQEVEDTKGEVELPSQPGKTETSTSEEETSEEETLEVGVRIEEDGAYTSKEEVAAYIHAFGHLPDNFITKKEAKKLGWDNAKGNLWDVAPGMSIGGDYFGNNEGLLPEKKGRDYYECDIDYDGGYRDAKRIVFSDDGLIFYTEDHYESFEQLYGED